LIAVCEWGAAAQQSPQSEANCGKIREAARRCAPKSPSRHQPASAEAGREQKGTETMKTILAAFIAMAIVGGLAGQASAAASTGNRGSAASFTVAEADYDSPAFGTQQWWQLQEDRG
jgi:hypothetical protein